MAQPKRKGLGGGLRLKSLAIVLAGVLVAVAGCGYWVLNTASGFQWLLATTARMSNGMLTVEDVNGTFSDLQIGKLQYQDEALKLAVHQFKLDWSPDQLLTGKLFVRFIGAERIDVYTGPSSEEETEETALPDDLSLPIDISIQAISVDEIRLYSLEDEQPDQQPEFSVYDLSLRLDSDTEQHRLSHFSLNNAELGALSASGHIRTARPFKLKSNILLDNAAHWGVTHAALSGSLEQLNVRLTHRKTSMQGAVIIQLDPFAHSATAMLKSLHASVTGFNPADFFPDDPEIPKADVALQAVVKPDGNDRLIGRLALQNGTAAPLDRNGLPLDGLSAALSLTEQTFKLGNIRIQFSDRGLISGNMAWHFDQSIGQAELNVSNLDPAAIDTQLQPAKISGMLRFAGDTDVQHITVSLSDQALKLDASAAYAANRIVLERLDLRHSQSHLTGKGELNLGGDDTEDNVQTFQFTGRLKQFNIADFIQGVESNLNTRIDISGSLSPELSAVLDYQFEKSHLNHQPVTGTGQIAFQAPLFIDSKAAFQIGSNQMNIDGKFGKPGDALALRITAPSLAQAGFELSGALEARVDLKGTAESPAFDFSIDSQALALSEDLSIDSLSAEGYFHSDALALKLKANELRTDGETQFKQLDLNVAGEKSAHILQTRIHVNDDITAVLHADGGLTGLDKPDTPPVWQGRLTELSVTGQVPVALQAPAPVTLSSERVDIRNAHMEIAGGQASINRVLWSPQQWQSDGYFSGIKIHPGSDLIPGEELLHLGGQWHIEAPASLSGLTGDIEISREKGDWHLPGELPQAVELQTLKLKASARNGAIAAQFDLNSALIGEIHAQLRLPALQAENGELLASATRLDGRLNLTIPDLSWLDRLSDNAMQAGGAVKLQTSIAGTLEKPALQGDIRGEQLVIALLDLGLNLHQGKLKAHFDESALHIEQLSFVSPYQPPPKDRLLKNLKLEKTPGSLTINGSLGFIDNTHDLTVNLDHLYLVHPPHYWIAVSGKSAVQFVNDTLDFEGEITADAGLLMQPPASRPQLADDIVIAEDNAALQNESGNEEQETIINLHVTLDLGKQFFLRVAGLEGRLDGNLQLQNDEKETLSAIGSIATRTATYTAYGQDLTVTRGIVNFHGPLDNPGLNILAVRKGLEVEAGVEVAGSVRRPEIKLVSTPHVPDTEKLSWIVLGRAPDISGLDTSLLITAASAILGGGSGGITDQLSDMLGVDEISFRQGSTPGSTQTSTPTSTSNGGSQFANATGLASSTLGGQIGTVGKRLSSRAYLSYERGITAATAGITKLTYSLTPKITVVTQAGEDSAVDLFYTFRFD
ncbi:translocation/assembly module TamB domain-containing protein [Nitrosomonas sp. Nm51]|uniref:translocation/assembly module TamB domain-containing protein n=1 Tax=Nitrosomonas sp. Nm51 TaxID=133720 RepID=UPI0015A69D96|nr:translocation/assembly module TamB domain-containing protein [Nitrosomonas sp. Nm51]